MGGVGVLCFFTQGGGLRPYPGLLYFALSGHGRDGIFLFMGFGKEPPGETPGLTIYGFGARLG